MSLVPRQYAAKQGRSPEVFGVRGWTGYTPLMDGLL
jgi:hypothetical protein